MKKKSRFISAGISLMMVWAFFFAGIVTLGLIAIPATAAGPGAGSLVINSPTGGAYLNTGDVLVQWTATDVNWTESRIWTEGSGWSSAWYNDTTNNSHQYNGLADGLYYVEVKGINASEPTPYLGNVTFHVDTVKPVVAIVMPLSGVTNMTNFTAAWTVNDASPYGTILTLRNLTTGENFTLPKTTALTQWMTNFTGADLNHNEMYTLEAFVEDEAGNNATASVTFRIAPTVEIIYPAAESVTPTNFTAAWVLGEVSGHAIASVNATLVNTTTGWSQWIVLTGPVSGMWITNFTGGVNLTEAQYSLTVVVADVDGGNSSASVNFGALIEAPSINITSPADSQVILENYAVIEWTASDVGSGLKTFEISYDNATWTDVGYVFSYNATGLADGLKHVWIKAIDNATFSTTDEVQFYIDLYAPVVTINFPSNMGLINKVDVDLNWTASDNGTGLTLVQLRLDAGDWFNVSVGNTSQMFNSLGEGTHALYVRAFDGAGRNTTAWVIFTVDTVGPEVVIAYPTEGTSTNQKNVTVSWTATDVTTNVAFIRISLDGVNWTVLPGNATSFNLGNLSDGHYTVYVWAADLAGNNFTAISNFTVDTVAPVLEIVAPVDGLWSSSSDIYVEWNASDNMSGISQTWIWYDVEAPIEVTNASNYTLMAVPDGTHVIFVKVLDMAGNEAVMNVTVNIDTSAPIVVIISPATDSFQNLTYVVTVWTSDAGDSLDYYQVSAGGTSWIGVGSGNSYTFSDLPEGLIDIYVRAYEKTGLMGEAVASVTIDLTAPEVAIEAPIDGAMIASTDVNMKWNGTDALSGIASYQIMIDNGSWMPMGLDNNYTFTNLVDGVHVANVRAYDQAGNFATASVSFVTDVTSPYVVITSPADGSMSAVNSVFVEWTVVDNTTGVSQVWAWVDNGTAIDVTGQDNATFVNLSEGSHVIHVKALDLVGNMQEKSANVLIDLSAPTIDITSPSDLAHLKSRTVTVTVVVADSLSGVQGVWGKLNSSSEWTPIVGNSYTFTVAADTTNILPYTFLVKAQDNVGNERISQVQFFVDTVAPSIASHTPATSANGVAKTATITVSFSEEMLTSSVTVTLSPSASGTYAWNPAHTQVTFTPSSVLEYAKVYTVTVAGTDLAGNALTGTTSWSFTTIVQVTGVVNDVNGNPIANATVTLSQGGTTMGTAMTGVDGKFAIEVPAGTYNLTISASGQKDLVRNDVVVGAGQSNVIPELGMSPVDNWTWLIVAVIIIVAALLILLYLRSKGKLGKKPEAPKEETKPAEKK